MTIRAWTVLNRYLEYRLSLVGSDFSGPTMPAISLEKGSKYRLAFHPSIIKGQWYFGPNCKGCSKPILILEDKSHGKTKPEFVGEGQFSIPCYKCGHDTLYNANEIQQFEADEDIPSVKDQRPTPSNSPRQPLLRKYSDAHATFGIGALEYRPACAHVIARCVTYWTYVESQLARLLAVMLKANTDPAIAMFLSLRNARAKTDALNSVAELTLQQDDYDLFLALMQYKDATESARNDLVHGVFGVSAAIPNGVAWVSTTHYTNFQANVAGLGLTDEAAASFKKQQFVYEIGDLETIAREIENLETQIGFFWGYLTSDNLTWRAIRYPQLCSEPHLRKELDLLFLRRKNKNANTPQ